MKNLPEAYRKAFTICKAIKQLCPSVWWEDWKDNLEADDIISTYVLKNCVYHLAVERDLWNKQTANEDVLQIVKDIYTKLEKFMNEKGFVPSVFTEDYNTVLQNVNFGWLHNEKTMEQSQLNKKKQVLTVCCKLLEITLQRSKLDTC